MTGTWERVAAADEIEEGEMIESLLGEREIALYKVEGRIYATGNICTHGAARLTEGYLEGCEIECPLHQGRFDIRSGKALCAPASEDIKSYEVRVEGGEVLIKSPFQND
jgi:naphthalene 1,2-dioxygenase system ferredoxin subunit